VILKAFRIFLGVA
jgi:excisionase family DNA binding protein